MKLLSTGVELHAQELITDFHSLP